MNACVGKVLDGIKDIKNVKVGFTLKQQQQQLNQ